MNILRLAFGDLRLMAKDWRAALWLLAMPLLFAYIFGRAFQGGGPQATWIPVIDLDRSELSALFLDQVRAEGYWIEVFGADKQSELKHKWPYGIVIPAAFGENILHGKAAELTVVKGDGTPDRILEVQSRLTQAIVHFTEGLVSTDLSHRTWNSETKDALQRVLSRPPILTVSHRGHSSLRPPPSGFNLSLPAFLVMFVMQMVIMFGGTTLVRDREQGQLARLLTAPVYAAEVYAGKILGRIFLALAQAALLLLGGSRLFHVALGDHPWFLVPVVLSLAIFAGALSILCGLACRNERQVVQIGIFATMILCALGGCWWPIEIVPDFFKTVAAFTPSYWGLHGLQSVLYFGKSYQPLSLECPILLGFAAVFLLLCLPAAKRLRKG